MDSPETWALVSNGVRARILRGLDGGDTDAPVELVRKTDAIHLRDHLSDRPGRSFASDGGGRRSAMEPGSDPILRDMQDFAREVAGLLVAAHREGRFARLVLVAAPKMLGILRSTLPPSLRGCVILERSANLVWLSETELRHAIREMLHDEPEEGSP